MVDILFFFFFLQNAHHFASLFLKRIAFLTANEKILTYCRGISHYTSLHLPLSLSLSLLLPCLRHSYTRTLFQEVANKNCLYTSCDVIDDTPFSKFRKFLPGNLARYVDEY